MHKISILVVTLMITLFSTQNSYGWGKEGHHMVAEVAWHYMSQHTQEMVTKYLNGITVDSAATWMDDVRSDPKYKYMSSWHFINIPKGQEYVPNPAETNCINEMNKACNNLKNGKLSDEEKRINIMVLIHLWGDLSQPLHTGYAEDRGGNMVTITFNGKETNLHSLWDGGIIYDRKIKLDNCLALYAHLSEKEKEECKKFNNVAALKQSRSFLPQIYDFEDATIDEVYAVKNQAVIEKQILTGGLRLAAMLDDVFKKQ